jgi:hypothetical protein
MGLCKFRVNHGNVIAGIGGAWDIASPLKDVVMKPFSKGFPLNVSFSCGHDSPRFVNSQQSIP